MRRLSLSERLEKASHPLTRELLELMQDKQSNLCVNIDITDADRQLELIEEVGESVCMIKTHVDMLNNFSESWVEELQEMAEDYRFLIFEDRKFADIGTIVKQQYSEGIYHIADWAHITNAHSVAGPGIIEGLKEIGLPNGRGLLLLAEMSSKGNLATGDYTADTVAMAEAHRDFVMGFISQQQLSEDPNLLHLTPGVSLASSGDALGQQYRTPERAIAEQGCDLIIVGRAIAGSEDPHAEAERYRQEAWNALMRREVHAAL